MILIFPLFSVIISSLLFKKDEPHGSLRATNFLNFKFWANKLVEKNIKNIITKKSFFL